RRSWISRKSWRGRRIKLGINTFVGYNFDVRKLDSIVGKIQRGDTQLLMRELPSESFDLIICDGPYAVTTHDWDNVADIQHFNLDLLKSFSRLLKPGG